MTLLQKLIAMQSQLSEATIEGELDQFIDDQHEDLHRLLDHAIRVLGKEEPKQRQYTSETSAADMFRLFEQQSRGW
jgi:hypothetical protein